MAGVQVVEHGGAVDLHVGRRSHHVTSVFSGLGTAQHAHLQAEATVSDGGEGGACPSGSGTSRPD